MLKLYNTLTRKKEIFKPIKKKQVGLYTCGPTVYGPGHLGHARSYVNFDILKRVLIYNNYKVKHILNITDVHDDMIKGANKLGITIQKLADQYIPLFKKDLADLNIIPANKYPRVIKHIPEIINMVKVLVDKSYGYVENDGSVYYNISKFKDYGKLSGIKLDEAKTGTRIKTDKYEKQNLADFALWKGWKNGEPYWKSPWGKGRPGWHIECSVMANKYLDKTVDIHAGAMDLKFPHHENEIAQSEAANGAKFVNYWVHAGLLEVDSQKMSKSLGNYIEIHEVQKKGFSPLVLRYLFLIGHYRSKMNFTWEALQGAQNSLNNLYNVVRKLKSGKKQGLGSGKKYKENFLKAINDDLNMPQSLAVMWALIKDEKVNAKEKYNLLLNFDKIFGLDLDKVKAIKIPEKIRKLIEKREKYRKDGDFKKSDEIRKEIEKLGFIIEDTEKGPQLQQKIKGV
ncbi:MAG: cysteine--tRNA ligase [Candidatus Pacebacteria bacterium]|nr:cysteine--tRNA ligase [Candidatus Paceibacterota bacterium]